VSEKISSTRAPSRRPIGERPEELLVVDVHLDASAELARRDLARHDQARRAIQEGVPNPRGQVRRPWPQGGQGHAGHTGEATDHVGHEGGTHFVAHEDEADSVRLQGLDRRQNLAAENIEDVAHPDGLQPPGQDLRIGRSDLSHVLLAILSVPRLPGLRA
jgi:hypothetical protein